MQVRTYKRKSRYISVFFGDDGEPLDVMRLASVGKGLLAYDDYSTADLARYKALKNEWEELPHEPCMVTMLPDDIYKGFNLEWGAYNEKALTLRTRNMVVPLDCLMDFISDYLNSHEDYTVDIATLYEICGGATHHMAYPEWITGSPYEKLAETMKIYLSEVLE